MKTIKIFLASSSELKEEREQFRNFINDENERLETKNIKLKLVRWENFLDAISDTRLQDEYNKEISDCDIVLCLFFTKVGKYTAEEFDTAYQVFKDKGKPKIWTYFKKGSLDIDLITEEINTLFAFKKKIADLGHFYSEFTNIDNLLNKYRGQLDKFLLQYEEDAEDADTDGDDNADPEQDNEAAHNPFNEWLTKKLIEAIRPYSKKANDFLTTNSDWETNTELIPTVKRIIISAYVGVLGIQIRKLMSIGEEEFSESKMKRYLENCVLTAKRALQLLCYSLLSKLWDHHMGSKGLLSETQTTTLVKFFKNAAEESITGYVALLRTLMEIFTENKLEPPIKHLINLQPEIQAGSAFTDACAKLHAVNDLLRQAHFTVNDCTESEKNLTIVLEHLSFLAEYKMISIKDIGYNQQRNDKEGMYLHNYSLLEGDSQFNTNNQGKIRKENAPVISYAVLLFKEDYRQNINLVPFIIDYNALGFNGGSKICFYSFCNTYDDLNLNYSFIEDNSRVIIKKSRNARPAEEQAFNKWLANPENRKDMNFDNVFNLFSEVKKTLAGLEEETTEDIL